MSHYTKKDIYRMVEEEDVEFIRLQFTDIQGDLKNVAVTTSQLERVLNNEYTIDGSAIEGFAGTAEPDMCLYPDLDTFTIFPWRPQQGKVARFLCDIYHADGTPFEADPRLILKRVLAEAKEMGLTFDVGPECEFFLFQLGENGEPTTYTTEKAGYFDVSPLDQGENARREMVMTLEDMGFEIETSLHEAAPAQHEIDLHYEEALKTADNIMTFRMVVRTIARRHGLHATFMPKPKEGFNGSGMHLNMSLSYGGKNLFASDTGSGISELAKNFAAGILKHAHSISALTNPLVNSYKRLVHGYEAPTYTGWSKKRLSPFIRIPFERGEHARIELRSPDACGNPYLVLAVCLAAGLEGIREKLPMPKEVTTHARLLTEEEREACGVTRLPRDLKEAIDAMEQSEFVKNVLGDVVFDAYLNNKKKEWESYCLQVSRWEIERYLDRI
ncbi:MAG: type I glutamate--ammonia ligase [Lachnospiraceae bacterium]|nr:type I glutamate--ammonia ligase [Lachnospiraceae bacterium]